MQLRILRGFLVRVAWEALGDFAPLRSLQLAALLLVSVVSSLRLTLNAPRRKRGAGAMAEGQRCLATGLFRQKNLAISLISGIPHIAACSVGVPGEEHRRRAAPPDFAQGLLPSPGSRAFCGCKCLCLTESNVLHAASRFRGQVLASIPPHAAGPH